MTDPNAALSEKELEIQESHRQAERRAKRLGQSQDSHDPGTALSAPPAEPIPFPDKQTAAANGHAQPTAPTIPQQASQLTEPLTDALAQIPKEEAQNSYYPPNKLQAHPVEAKPPTEIPDDLSIPKSLRREQPKPQPPTGATKPNGSLPPQHDEQAQDLGFAARQQYVPSATEKLIGRQAPQRDAPAQDDIAASAQRVQPTANELNGRQVPQQQVHMAAPQQCVQPAPNELNGGQTPPAQNADTLPRHTGSPGASCTAYMSPFTTLHNSELRRMPTNRSRL
jgi:hypothetical protein